jgi:ADP-ribosylation factor-like protein 1
MESLKYNNLNMEVWDVGGQTTLRPYWKTYFPSTDCLLFMIDSTDRKRLEIVKTEIFYLNDQEELNNVPFCICMNKSDLKEALEEKQVN